ncbi:Septal ring factor EnvC, activator of murein hydrolases AmiA and AmiB [Roseivivax lentus]|uniref:Septal ring factor EnvC, activator of murein hydrolases AmiA and AmiB n=1 Tax=Roseivivax lentus TaxID=633194 RepID=A0A1N7MHL4_9RHOB|nr:peptidoglycan DD-metalloendopeptidase family protein [Roseivivax lentus]SIS85498.1 Septal ring factor EnvC, activator of murein hydrolases AmiA and AmiB [Roseivivax lentus]
MIRALVLSLALWVGLLAAPLAAQDAGAAARQAAAALDQAGRDLAAAERASDRVAALTATVRAYEDGLTALRDGLRDAAIREAALRRDLSAREREVASLLAALQTLGRADVAQQLLHPEGPLGAARSGMLVSAVTPGLAAEAQALARDLQEVATLRQLQENAAETLRDGLSGAQEARAALSQAVADRTDLPRRFTEDPVQTAVLIAATETLEGFASGLTQITGPDMAPESGARLAKGDLALPVSGRILRRAGEADAAGVARPGIVLATRPEALVTTPAAATIRYVGPLLDYGLVAILEPQADILFVFAGLETLFGAAGQVLPEGAPIGLMGGGDGTAGTNNTSVLQAGEGTGNTRPETLYIEVREGDTPVDPLAWFATDKG